MGGDSKTFSFDALSKSLAPANVYGVFLNEVGVKGRGGSEEDISVHRGQLEGFIE